MYDWRSILVRESRRRQPWYLRQKHMGSSGTAAFIFIPGLQCIADSCTCRNIGKRCLTSYSFFYHEPTDRGNRSFVKWTTESRSLFHRILWPSPNAAATLSVFNQILHKCAGHRRLTRKRAYYKRLFRLVKYNINLSIQQTESANHYARCKPPC